MFCPNCGKEVSDKIRFCPYCGKNFLEDCASQKQENETQTETIQKESVNLSKEETSTVTKEEQKKKQKEEKIKERQRKREEDFNQKSNLGAILFSVITGFFLLYSLTVHFLEKSLDSQFMFLLILLAADCILLLCAIYPQRRMQILRGITLLVLVETFIIANMSGIEDCLHDIENAAKIENVVVAVWYATILLWLLFEGAKTIFCPKSEYMASTETIIILVNFLCAILCVLYEYHLYQGSALFSASQRDFILKTEQYYVLSAFIISNMFLSWRCTKKK